MSLNEALVLLLVYGAPILFFAYMATDVLLRNKKKTEHILLSLISLCYLLLFAEEYVRHQVPVEYSPLLSSMWLSSVGIMIPGLGFHFLIKFTRLDLRMPRYVYPAIFYLPLIIVLLNLTTGAKIISAQEFAQAGMWKVPVYSTGYYIAMTASIINNLLYLIPLLIAKARSNTPEQRSIYNQLIMGVWLSVGWHTVFGYINYGELLPPYPYLYSGLIWCYYLRHTMKKYDFLSLYDKRYEKLFNLNPAAILLIDLRGGIQDTNPAARQLLDSIRLSHVQFFDLLDAELKHRIRHRTAVNQYEMVMDYGGKQLVLLADGDYIWVDNELHVLLILRDITREKKYQEEIKFLAYHDPLTRMPNRRYFYEKLEEALQESKRNQESLALLLIDLDKIKLLNDTRGHLAGDEALQHASQIIMEAVSGRGVAARMGGDEFIMFVRHSPSVQEIQLITEQMQTRFAGYTAKYKDLPVGMSIGISFYPQDGEDGQALINLADNAMYEMKRGRKS